MKSRVFKFRVWIHFENKMHYLSCMADMDSVNIFNGEVMQFTGQYDKDNRDVWEGDILADESGGYYQVIWNDKEAAFGAKLIKSSIIEHFKGEVVTLYLADVLKETSFPGCVIGNIYENPEFLEDFKG